MGTGRFCESPPLVTHSSAPPMRSGQIALAILAFTVAVAPRSPREDVDLLLRNGTIIDGTGAPPRVADLAIRGDRIVFLGDASKASLTPKRAIDVRGLVVAPGFID